MHPRPRTLRAATGVLAAAALTLGLAIIILSRDATPAVELEPAAIYRVVATVVLGAVVVLAPGIALIAANRPHEDDWRARLEAIARELQQACNEDGPAADQESGPPPPSERPARY